MQEDFSVTLSGKDATKLLEALTKDPQLRAEDDPSVMVEEQYPSEHRLAESAGHTLKPHSA
jgi:hypothetical protein